MQNQSPSMLKWVWVAIGVVVVGVAIWLIGSNNYQTTDSTTQTPGTPTSANSVETASADDTTSVIEKELQGTNAGSADADIQSTDTDLNSL